MLELPFGPFRPYHSPPGAWKLRKCSVSRLFSKSFDKVDIDITQRKLKSLGIHGQLGKWLLSLLSVRLQSVPVEGKKSQPKPVLSGVPQGLVLGPLMFLILIGDIDQNAATSFLSNFAEDTHIGHDL